MGFLCSCFAFPGTRLFRQWPSLSVTVRPDFSNSAIAQIRAVCAHVGDLPGFIELLRQIHSLFGLELERVAGRLLQRGSRERSRGSGAAFIFVARKDFQRAQGSYFFRSIFVQEVLLPIFQPPLFGQPRGFPTVRNIRYSLKHQFDSIVRGGDE